MASHGQPSPHQRPIQQDWANREYIEVITCSIKKITDFLNSFGMILACLFTLNSVEIDMDTTLQVLAFQKGSVSGSGTGPGDPGSLGPALPDPETFPYECLGVRQYIYMSCISCL